jgi:hypothetical protein
MKKIIAIALLILFTALPSFAQNVILQKTGGVFGESRGLGIIYAPDSPYEKPPKAMIIVGVYKDSPSSNILHTKDYIIKINGKSVIYMSSEEIANSLESTKPVFLDIFRNNKEIKINLTPLDKPLKPENLMESFHKVGKFKGFESGNYFRSNISTGDGVKLGDAFFIFDDETLLGKAVVKEANSDYSYLIITETTGKIDNLFQYKYSLVYCGYYPITSRPYTKEELKNLEAAHKKQQEDALAVKKAEASAPKYTEIQRSYDGFGIYGGYGGYYYPPYLPYPGPYSPLYNPYPYRPHPKPPRPNPPPVPPQPAPQPPPTPKPLPPPALIKF